MSGHLIEGLSLLERWSARRGLIADGSGTAWSLATLGEAYALVNREDDAIRVINQALDFARAYNRRAHEAWVLRALGEIASHRDPPDAEKAETAYRQAMNIADELGLRPILAHCHLGLGKLYGRVAKREEACAHLTTAAAMCRDMGMRFWLVQAEEAASRL